MNTNLWREGERIDFRKEFDRIIASVFVLSNFIERVWRMETEEGGVSLSRQSDGKGDENVRQS
jgi:hypothetical protein